MLFKNTVETDALELLRRLQSEALLKNFHLVGGTALSLYFGHRKSIDLDLFSPVDFDVNEVHEFLEQNYSFASDYFSQNTLKGSINGIKVDLLSHKYPFVGSLLKEDGLKLMSLEDISAMKLNSIAGNGTRSKDFIDIYFILKQYTVDEILEFYKSKYSSRNLLHALKSLIYFDEINNKDWPKMILEKNLKLSTVKKEISKKVKLFNNEL